MTLSTSFGKRGILSMPGNLVRELFVMLWRRGESTRRARGKLAANCQDAFYPPRGPWPACLGPEGARARQSPAQPVPMSAFLHVRQQTPTTLTSVASRHWTERAQHRGE